MSSRPTRRLEKDGWRRSAAGLGGPVMRFLLDPRLYIVWSAFVVITLVASYNFDPYVFGFATLGLAWATGFVTIAGLVAICSRSASRGARLVVAVAVVVAWLAVAAFLAVLGGFKWA